jgi:hypothetical protein
MQQQGVLDRKGELFAYIEGGVLYTLDGDPTGRMEGKYIVDMAGNRMWRVFQHAIYNLDSSEAVGYFSSPSPEDD